MTKTVLVVDDDPTQRRLIQAVLEREGFAVAHAENGDQAISHLAAGGLADVVLLDMIMPGISGQETLVEMRARGLNQPVIVVTATGGVDTIVQAMQAGAIDFFIKPRLRRNGIIVSIRNAPFHGAALRGEVDRLKKHASGRTGFSDLIGSSPAMTMVKRLGERAAKSSIPILITGESGVGKEVIARAVHGSSERGGEALRGGQLQKRHIPRTSWNRSCCRPREGQLHFEAATTDKHLGKFQEANGGTLFLDEVGELPLDIQVKLLRALQESEIDPVGGKRPIKVDVRIVSATNRDLSLAVKEGRFREDLFYRLNVFTIEAPALASERKDDVPALVGRLRQALQRRGAASPWSPWRPETLAYLLRLRLAGQRPPVGECGLPGHRARRRPLSAAARLPGDQRGGAARRPRRAAILGGEPARRSCGWRSHAGHAPGRAGRQHPSTSAATCARSRRSSARPDPARHRNLRRAHERGGAPPRHPAPLHPLSQGPRTGAGGHHPGEQR